MIRPSELPDPGHGSGPDPGSDQPPLRSPAPKDSRLIRGVEVRRSPRRTRTVAARLEAGILIVSLPAGLTRGEEAEWIERMRERIETKERRRRLNARGDLEHRAHQLNRRYFGGRLSWSSLSYVTNQSQRFGSCTPATATIRLADCLAEMPEWVRDYVIVHELAHLMEPNHSPAFWELVGRYPLTERARGYLIAKGLESW